MAVLEQEVLRPQRMRGRWFYVAMGVLSIGLVAWGFSGTYFRPLLSGSETFQGLIHVHAAVFTVWMLFFIMQTSLAAGGRLNLHRTWGWAGAAVAAAVLVVGVAVTLNGLARGVAAGQVEAAQRFTIIPLTDMVLFGAFVGLAVWNRRRGEIHKRLMLLATICLLPAAVARLTFPVYGETMTPIAVVIGAMVLIGMLFDLYSRRAIHPVYLTGGIIVIASMPLRELILASDAWLSISGELVRLVS